MAHDIVIKYNCDDIFNMVGDMKMLISEYEIKSWKHPKREEINITESKYYRQVPPPIRNPYANRQRELRTAEDIRNYANSVLRRMVDDNFIPENIRNDPELVNYY